MKRKLVLSFLLLILIFAVSCGKKQDMKQTTKSETTQWEKVKKSGKLVVATSGTLFPTSYHAKKGDELTGYEIEIIKEMAKRMTSVSPKDEKINLYSLCLTKTLMMV